MRKLSMFFFATTAFFLSTATAIQEFESNVIEQKFNSSSTIIIDQKEIQKSRAKDLTTLLAAQANISITQSNFQPNSIYLRGGDSSHVLILVDGVPFYDATTVQRTVNLNSLNLKSIQRIEVIKGSQSVLFGGQALSGVIKIDTIPTDIKPVGFLQTQVGTQQSTSVAAGIIEPVSEHQGIIARGSYAKRENLSPVQDSQKVYPSRLGTGEVGYTYRDSEIVGFAKVQTSFDKTMIASTNSSYQSMDADNFETSNYQLNGTASVKALGFYGQPSLVVGSQRSARIYEQDAASGGGMPTKQDYAGQLQVARFEIAAVNTNPFKVRVGLSATEEKLIYRDRDVQKSDDGTSFQGAFVKVDYNPFSFLRFEAGQRADFKKFKDQISTYQIGATIIDQIRIEYSTGFKQPSLFQLYSAYGNTSLQPEKSTSFSVSYEKNITADWSTSITGFDNHFSNLILIFGSPQHYENVAESQTKGVEAATGLRFPDQQFSVQLALGYQEPKDLSQNDWLVRRPLRTASLKLRKEYEKLGLGLAAVHNGDRRDKTGSTSYGTINSYTYVNATVDYQKNESLTFFARGQNILNNRYETSYTFYDEGANFSVGAETIF